MWTAAWGSIVIAIMISASLNYSVLIRIVVAYAIWEGSAIVLQIVRGILFWCIKKGSSGWSMSFLRKLTASRKRKKWWSAGR